jgi:adenosylcobinamide-phosphate synthase
MGGCLAGWTMLMPWSSFGSASALVPLGWLLAAALVMALAIDRFFGEPPARTHPVVWMGHYLKTCGGMAVQGAPAPAFLLGAGAWCVGALLAGALAWALQAWALSQLLQWLAAPGLAPAVSAGLLTVLLAWGLKAMLSWRMLDEEVGAVEDELAQSLSAGRERLSRLVSRDTAQLSAVEVRESAIESLAENLNDSVVAPVFWFVLFGLPGAAVYRFANTADAMWGYRGMYRGQNWEWAGKWAARADDVLSWLPARLTAFLLVLAARRCRPLPVAALRQEACKTPSPNSGWPMAAMALALDVRLGKPAVYTLNPGGRQPAATDTARARVYAARVVAMLAVAAPAALLVAAQGRRLWTAA